MELLNPLIFDYTEAELPDADDVAVGTEVFNTTYQVKVRSNGTSWMYLGIGTATLSALPLPTAVPSGTKFNITDLGTGSAVFMSNGSHWLPVGEVLLFVDPVGTTLTATTTETVLTTFTLNKKLASPKMTIVVNSVWSMNNSANIKIPRVRFGGVTGAEYVNPLIASNSSFQSECLIRFKNALNSQVGMASTQWPAYSAGGGATVASSLDMSVNNADIVLTGQLANAADNLTLRAYTVTLRG